MFFLLFFIVCFQNMYSMDSFPSSCPNYTILCQISSLLEAYIKGTLVLSSENVVLWRNMDDKVDALYLDSFNQVCKYVSKAYKSNFKFRALEPANLDNFFEFPYPHLHIFLQYYRMSDFDNCYDLDSSYEKFKEIQHNRLQLRKAFEENDFQKVQNLYKNKPLLVSYESFSTFKQRIYFSLKRDYEKKGQSFLESTLLDQTFRTNT